jgi:hypothetical protein
VPHEKNSIWIVNDEYRINLTHFTGWIVWFMVFYATLNNISVISWQSVLLVEEIGGLRENHRPGTSHWQILSHNVVNLTLIEIGIHNSGFDLFYWLVCLVFGVLCHFQQYFSYNVAVQWFSNSFVCGAQGPYNWEN